MDINWLSVIAILAVVIATASLGVLATRVVRTTSDFFVASRTVGPLMNAAAISGEYLSAASFLGVAGMIMKFGYDAMWYPVGYAAGYLFLLLFVAAPLRRFGAYTIPDYAEGRFTSYWLRKIAVVFVMIIGFFYMMPQMKGAGLTLQTILHTPYWVGVVVVGCVITMNVVLAGMKGITFVQAFQFWLKLFAVTVPVFVLLTFFGNYSSHLKGQEYSDVPRFTEAHTIAYQAGSKLKFNAPTVFVAEEAGIVHLNDQNVPVEAGQTLNITPGEMTLVNANRLKFEAGQPVPNAPTSDLWMQAFGPLTGDSQAHPVLSLLYTYSLIIAVIFGTAGLPHILVRFYTNTDGRSARHTTLLVLGLIGLFYLFPPVIGTLGRVHAPELYAMGTTDSVALSLPNKVEPGWLAQLLSAIAAAGAFAAFMSTFSGLLVSVAGALSHDIYGKILRPTASNRERRQAFRVCAIIAGGSAIVAGLFIDKFDINMLVGWAFAIAASSFFPMLVLGTWWKGLTRFGAAAGMLAGGLLASTAIVITMIIGASGGALTTGGTVSGPDPLTATLLAQPAIWSVPLSFVTMIVVSLMTRQEKPEEVNQVMLRLHAPEALGLRSDYISD
ncbi:MAG TPA: cation acetate symporter [Chloroflexia bacterium]|nr:cation acetate symporter [Chloroflexia bacterium]